MAEIQMQLININNELKCCKRCQLSKSLRDFHINSKNRGSKPRSVCKTCRQQERKNNPDKFREKDRKYYRENKQRIKSARHEYYQANHERIKKANRLYVQNNNERVKETQRKWREANSDRLKSINRNYKRNNAEKYKQYYREYRLNNPAKEAAKIHKRRARIKASNGSFTPSQWRNLCEKYKNVCLCCGTKDQKLTPDHVIPLSKGGSNDIENIQPLCLKCNVQKSTKIIDYRK